MNKKLDKRLNKAALLRLYPLPETLEARTHKTLNHLKTEKEIPMKRKISLALAIVTIATLTAGGLALSQYGALDFLFGTPSQEQTDQLTPLTQEVNISNTLDQVSIDINSVFYDGESFAMDWTITNTKPEAPRYVTIENFQAGGQRLWNDGNDSFDSQWLPGVFSSDGSMRDGEYIPLPLESLEGDSVNIVMDIGVLTPSKPLYYLQRPEGEMTPEQQETWMVEQNKIGEQKLQEGYIVMDEDAFFIPFPADEENKSGFARVIGPITNILSPEDYTQNTLSVSFELDIKKARQARENLSPLEEYIFNKMTTSYHKAVKTPLGIYLTLLSKPLEEQQEAYDKLVNNGRWKMSDGEGKPLEVWPLQFESMPHTFADSVIGRKITIAMPLSKDELPEQISITFYPEDDSLPMISPVKIK